MIDLLESVDYMVRNAPYRKFRPAVTLKEDPKEWYVHTLKKEKVYLSSYTVLVLPVKY